MVEKYIQDVTSMLFLSHKLGIFKKIKTIFKTFR